MKHTFNNESFCRNARKFDKDTFLYNAVDKAQNHLIELAKTNESGLLFLDKDQKTLEEVFAFALSVAAYVKSTRDSRECMTAREQFMKMCDVAFDMVNNNDGDLMPDFINQPNHATVPEVL